MIERYTRPEMGRLWSLENKFRVWLEVELAVCEAWFVDGVIPADDMESIRQKADIDVTRILEHEERTRHDVIAFLTTVEEFVGPSARFIHLGCTSSDIVDTANGVLLMRSGRMLLQGLEKLLGVLKGMAKENAGRLCMGRTHGIHAEPTSFGLKMAGFYAEFDRHRVRLERAVENISVGKISGAVGTYAYVPPVIEARACAILGLAADPISTQIVQRDRYAEFFTALALLGGGVERICLELRHLQRTEVLEVEEGFGKGQKGSSAMPHKKNPISAENLTGLARLLRSNSLAAMENMALWHERDISHSSVERVIMPDSTILADYMLARLAGLLSGLRVIGENMERNLWGSYGLFFSQAILLALVESGHDRQKAYEDVQRIAMECWTQKKNFPDAVRRDSAILAALGEQKLTQLFDPANFLKHEAMILERVLGA